MGGGVRVEEHLSTVTSLCSSTPVTPLCGEKEELSSREKRAEEGIKGGVFRLKARKHLREEKKKSGRSLMLISSMYAEHTVSSGAQWSSQGLGLTNSGCIYWELWSSL